MNLFWLYLILKLDTIIGFFIIICVLSAIFVLICFLNTVDCFEKQRLIWKKWAINWTIISLMSSVMVVLVPSTRDATIMMGGWAVQEVVTSDTAKRMASKSVEIIEKWLSEKTK